jgi:hypothetical protein
MSSVFELFYAVPYDNRYTLVLENISLQFLLQQVFELMTSLGYVSKCRRLPSVFFSFHPVPYFIPSFLNVNALIYFLHRL